MGSMQEQVKLADRAEETLANLGFELDEIEVNEFPEPAPVRRRRPRWLVPALLLVATIISMTWAGIVAWSPVNALNEAYENQSLFEIRRYVLANWMSGILFSVSLAIILGAHELGHYFVTRIYGIQSSLPIFIPFPISPTGTCGAVILMDGFKADRKEIFDIGLAGPLAGLVFAIPIAAIGLMYGQPPQSRGDIVKFGQPIAIQWLAQALPQHEKSAGVALQSDDSISNNAMNPLLMAAWVGLLVTGLNMVPISQLDGGHVIFGLLGPQSRPISWMAYFGCVGYVIYTSYTYGQPVFVLMLLLIPLIGITHPPSRNDDVALGVPRQVVGALSLAIPFLCIPLSPVTFL